MRWNLILNYSVSVNEMKSRSVFNAEAGSSGGICSYCFPGQNFPFPRYALDSLFLDGWPCIWLNWNSFWNRPSTTNHQDCCKCPVLLINYHSDHFVFWTYLLAGILISSPILQLFMFAHIHVYMNRSLWELNLGMSAFSILNNCIVHFIAVI